jgi:hypothetical protein
LSNFIAGAANLQQRWMSPIPSKIYSFIGYTVINAVQGGAFQLKSIKRVQRRVVRMSSGREKFDFFSPFSKIIHDMKFKDHSIIFIHAAREYIQSKIE